MTGNHRSLFKELFKALPPGLVYVKLTDHKCKTAHATPSFVTKCSN